MRMLNRSMVALVAAMVAAPALAHGPILKCVALDRATVRCRGGDAEGDGAPGSAIEVVGYGGKTLLTGKLDRNSTYTFARPGGGYFVLFDEAPGEQAIVEHDEIRAPRSGERARWMRK